MTGECGLDFVYGGIVAVLVVMAIAVAVMLGCIYVWRQR